MKPPSSLAGPRALTRAARSPKTRDHTRSFPTPHGDRLRIRIYSDLHLEFAPFVPPANDADVIVLAGDIANGAAGIEWARETFGGPVIYLGCNLWTDYSLAPQAERPTVIESARRLNPDYQLIRHGSRSFAPEDAITLCARHRGWLAAALAAPFPGKTVVITHFAPHPRSIAPAYAGHRANPGFVLDLEDMMGSAALWIHGHTHTFFDYRVRGTRVICNPRGYPAEPTGFRPGFTAEI